MLEYAAQVWNPHTAKNIEIPEPVNQRAAHLQVADGILCLRGVLFHLMMFV